MQTAVEWLRSLPRLAGEASLDRINALLVALGNPEASCKYVHIAGTNGKGTVAALTASILHQAGFKTGLTISPYVVDFRERFQINGEMISPDELEACTAQVQVAAETLAEGLAQFEAVTAVALLWFSQQKCEIVVLETGLGGRFDATNAVQNTLVAAITRIDFDHTELLGNTLAQIAGEKAGIIKPGCTAVTYPVQEQEALQVIAAQCIKQKVDLIAPAAEDITFLKGERFENRFDYGGYQVNLPFMGAHQVCNAAMAIEIALELWRQGYEISDEAIVAGLQNARMPARVELLRREPLLILDGCHNPAGVKALAATLKANHGQKPVAVLGVLADKSVKEMLAALAPAFSQVYAVTPDCPRALPAAQLAEQLAPLLPQGGVTACASLNDALAAALAQPQGAVVCGSLYLAAEARPLLLQAIN